MRVKREFKVEGDRIVWERGMEEYVSVRIECSECLRFEFWRKEVRCEYGKR